MVRGGANPEGPEQSKGLIASERGEGESLGGLGGQDPPADAMAPGENGRESSGGINSPRGAREESGRAGTPSMPDPELESRASEEIFSPKPHPLHEQPPRRGLRQRWLRKMRCMFCCLAPADGVEFYHPTPEPVLDEVEGELTDAESLGIPHPPLPPEGYSSFVIGPKAEGDAKKKTLVLDLDETLVHSSFRPVEDPDFIIPVDIDGKLVDVYVMKRPWLEHFMRSVGSRFEVVVFTASLSKYADPLLDLLDETSVVRWRLFREACSPYEGNYVKDLNRLGRDLSSTIIVDNSPLSYIFQPANALPIGAFLGEAEDQELLDMVPTLLDMEGVEDVRDYLAQKAKGLARSALSNGVSLVPLGHGVGSEVRQS